MCVLDVINELEHRRVELAKARVDVKELKAKMDAEVPLSNAVAVQTPSACFWASITTWRIAARATRSITDTD